MDRQPKAMQFHDRGYQIKAKTPARGISYLVGTVETPQHRLTLLLADAGAGIGHAHDGFGITTQQFDVYLPAFSRKLDGVVDEVGDRFDQQAAMGAHRELLRHPDMQ